MNLIGGLIYRTNEDFVIQSLYLCCISNRINLGSFSLTAYSKLLLSALKFLKYFQEHFWHLENANFT